LSVGHFWLKVRSCPPRTLFQFNILIGQISTNLQPKILNLQSRGFFLRNRENYFYLTNSTAQNEKLNELSSMTELEKIISKKFKKQTSVHEFRKILDKNGMETLEDWKKLSEEEKKIFPVGLKILLNDLTSNYFEILKFLRK
jgi:hypothetical protein